MFVWWGGHTGAKKFVKRQIIYNSKDYVEHYPYNVIHTKNICHHTPKPLRYDSKWDVSRKADVYSRKIENPNELHTLTTGWERDTDFMTMIFEGNTCDNSHRSFGGFFEYGNKTDRYFFRNYKTDRHGFKIKNKPTDLIEFPFEDIPECHTIFPYVRHAGYSFRNVKISDWFRSQTNVVPYKTDLVESAINHLDNWGEYRNDKYWWEVDKKTLWRYLDDLVFISSYDVEERLREAGIEYEYFNLDKDDWAKTFQLEKRLPRTIYHHVYFQMNYLKDREKKPYPLKKAYENHRRMTEIAKEYVASRGKKDNRLEKNDKVIDAIRCYYK